MGVLHDIRLSGQSLRFPLRQPLRIAAAYLLPLREITRLEGTQEHSAAEEGGHGR